MKYKILACAVVSIALVSCLGLMVYNFLVPDTYNVFIETYSHGKIQVDDKEIEGTAAKYKVVCDKDEQITLTIIPDRTSTKNYYDLSKLYVSGVDVTSEVEDLTYTTTVTQKLSIVAYFKAGKAPSDFKAEEK